jgi:uncharacterized membrane protein YcfT
MVAGAILLVAASLWVMMAWNVGIVLEQFFFPAAFVALALGGTGSVLLVSGIVRDVGKERDGKQE